MLSLDKGLFAVIMKKFARVLVNVSRISVPHTKSVTGHNFWHRFRHLEKGEGTGGLGIGAIDIFLL